MPLTIIDGPTIRAGQSLSDAVDCSAGPMVRIAIPQEFTPAHLTFQISSNGDLFNDLYDANGNEMTIHARPDTSIRIGTEWGKVAQAFLKIRSGSRNQPVLQREDTKLGIAIETP